MVQGDRLISARGKSGPKERSDMVIAFLTLGCKLNYAETSTYERGFKAAGLDVVPWQEKADIYIPEINVDAVAIEYDAEGGALTGMVNVERRREY